MPLTDSDKTWLLSEFNNVRKDIDGIHKTIYGSEGRTGLVADVHTAKLDAKKARERILYLWFPALSGFILILAQVLLTHGVAIP